MKRLKKEILQHLINKTPLSENTLRKNISLIKSDYPRCTSNAAAQILARKHNTTVMNKLDGEDKSTLPNMETKREKVIIKNKRKKSPKKIIIFIDYLTEDFFRKEHIKEINKAYTHQCYTATYILCRKVIENMLIDILRTKFSEKSKENKELYFDTSKKRFKDFGVILDNLKSKKDDFDLEKKAVERLVDKCKKLKDDANNKTHSWFHIVKSKSEIDNVGVQEIIELIKVIESKI